MRNLDCSDEPPENQKIAFFFLKCLKCKHAFFGGLTERSLGNLSYEALLPECASVVRKNRTKKPISAFAVLKGLNLWRCLARIIFLIFSCNSSK